MEEQAMRIECRVALDWEELEDWADEQTRREKQAEHERETERELIEWLRTMSPDSPEYSDVYKDVYGVRPRRR